MGNIIPILNKSSLREKTEATLSTVLHTAFESSERTTPMKHRGGLTLGAGACYLKHMKSKSTFQDMKPVAWQKRALLVQSNST